MKVDKELNGLHVDFNFQFRTIELDFISIDPFDELWSRDISEIFSSSIESKQL